MRRTSGPQRRGYRRVPLQPRTACTWDTPCRDAGPRNALATSGSPPRATVSQSAAPSLQLPVAAPSTQLASERRSTTSAVRSAGPERDLGDHLGCRLAGCLHDTRSRPRRRGRTRGTSPRTARGRAPPRGATWRGRSGGRPRCPRSPSPPRSRSAAQSAPSPGERGTDRRGVRRTGPRRASPPEVTACSSFRAKRRTLSGRSS